MYYISLTPGTNYRAKTSDDVSKFMHSDWITQSYYSSPKHWNWFLDIWYPSLTFVHYNSEHRLAIVTESFCPLNLYHTTSFVKVQIRSNATSHAIPDTVYFLCQTGLNWPQPTKADTDVMLRHVDF